MFAVSTASNDMVHRSTAHVRGVRYTRALNATRDESAGQRAALGLTWGGRGSRVCRGRPAFSGWILGLVEGTCESSKIYQQQ